MGQFAFAAHSHRHDVMWIIINLLPVCPVFTVLAPSYIYILNARP